MSTIAGAKVAVALKLPGEEHTCQKFEYKAAEESIESLLG